MQGVKGKSPCLGMTYITVNSELIYSFAFKKKNFLNYVFNLL